MTTTLLSPAPAMDSGASGIFSAPLKAKTEAALILKKKNRTQAGLQMLLSLVALGTYAFLFFMPQFDAYLQFENRLQEIGQEISDGKNQLEDLQKIRDSHKAAYEEEFRAEQGIMDIVLPPAPDKLGLIRLMEDFATKLSIESPPFEFNSITFESPVKKEKYQVLPFQTSISASRENFARFLELISLSGNLDPKSRNNIRLMEISNITLSYKGVDANGKDLGVNFGVKINAYSR